jgi:hypothetical protein
MTGPVVAPAGTGAVMFVLLHAEGVAATPLNATMLLPCEAPKPVPVIVTVPPIGAEVGLSDVTRTLLNLTRAVYVPVAVQFGSSRIV